ncbi:MAG: Neutral endopeptidase [Candidatus Celerinatantimonas neptuna]|nr:MAG: Neutral endopeptidase [Candidatus Celerinatantimonas neptuna]
MNTRLIARSAILALSCLSCADSLAAKLPSPVSTATPVILLKSGIDQNQFDRSVPFSQDFFLAVNGHWLKTTKIPADRTSYGSFSVLYDRSQDALHQIMKQAAAHLIQADTAEGKIGRFYRSYMNVDRVNQLGITPIQKELGLIHRIQTHQQLVQVMGMLIREGVKLPLDVVIDSDAKQADQYAVYLYQSGLGLPDRGYYLSKHTRYQALLHHYHVYLKTMMRLSDAKHPDQMARSVIRLEHDLAKLQWSKVASRNVLKTYNKMSVQQFQQLAGPLDWLRFARALGLEDVHQLIVAQPSYIPGLGKLLYSTSLQTWKAYLQVHVLTHYADYLSSPFKNAYFTFYGKTLSGKKQAPARWKDAVDDSDTLFGQMLGQIYVRDYFGPQAKAYAKQMVSQLIAAYRQSIRSLTWMSLKTKDNALKKLNLLSVKIGYPNHWRNYDNLHFSENDLVGNIRSAYRFEYQYGINKLGHPVDRNEWFMNPQTVNAYYNPGMNEIVFPAAILQAPFFDASVDPAVNYGGIGAVIGHEIGHGFDDQGSQYDGYGNLQNWWSNSDRKAFNQRTGKLVSQYNQYFPFADQHVNGKLTLGENIGDLGGVSIAYKAYHMSLKGKKPPVIDGLTGDQRFFLAWAQIWRYKYRDKNLRERLLSDPHSPAHYRVNGVLVNVPAFYLAFEVKPGDGMYVAPENRVQIW